MADFILKEEEGIRKFDNCLLLEKDKFRTINKVKIQILELLAKKPMFINQIAGELGINEQNVYYHMKDMGELLDVVEEKKIRGTIAKKYKPKSLNICLSLSRNFKEFNELDTNKTLNRFFFPFIKDNTFNAKIIVGNPDPHGSHKARARDGHYAIDLALYLGGYCNVPKNFSVGLDVDVNLKEVKNNLIIVGGPVTNLIMGKINKHMGVGFTDEKHWGIKGRKGIYTDDNCGIIARIPNPYNKGLWVMIIAGIRFSGTKAAVIALTRNTQLLLNRFTGQKEFYAVIRGFDMDGDGKIDSVELLE